jgi:hypothetical protein
VRGFDMDYNLKLQKINKDDFSPYGIYLDGPAGTPAHSENSFDWLIKLKETDKITDTDMAQVLKFDVQRLDKRGY